LDTLPSHVFKILPAADWMQACVTGRFEGSSDDARDGFIHLSSGDQVAGTLAKHFNGHTDLVLVAFETEALGPDLKWEVSRGGAAFPHLYAPLPTAKAAGLGPIPDDAEARAGIAPAALTGVSG